jgi:uncharacterized membrane protein
MSKHAQTILTLLMFGVVLATGSLLVSVWLFRPQEFTPVIAVLNEAGQAGPYPTNVTRYTNITVNVDVYNYMGVVQYFYVRTKLATATTMATTSSPSSAPLLIQHERILSHGDRWLFPVTLNMTSTGLNFRLTFELWRYEPSADAIVYTGRWVHIPLNVTSG